MSIHDIEKKAMVGDKDAVLLLISSYRKVREALTEFNHGGTEHKLWEDIAKANIEAAGQELCETCGEVLWEDV